MTSVGRRRDHLVAAPGAVAEPPRRFVFGDDPHAQFVRDEDDRAGERPAGGDQLAAANGRRLFRKDLPPLLGLVEEVVDPEGEAVDEEDPVRRRPADGAGQIDGLFDRLPGGGAPRLPVLLHPLRRLRVDDGAGRDVGARAGEGLRQRLGVGALAAPASAGDEDVSSPCSYMPSRWQRSLRRVRTPFPPSIRISEMEAGRTSKRRYRRYSSPRKWQMRSRMTPPWVKATTVPAGSAAIRPAAAPIRPRKAPMLSPSGEGEIVLQRGPALDGGGIGGRDLREVHPLPAAEVDLPEVVVDREGPFLAQGDFGGLPGPEERAAEDVRPFDAAELPGQGRRLAPPLRGEGRVRPADVPAAVPLSQIAVTDENQALCHRSSRKQKIPAPFDVGMPYFILNPLPIRDPSPRGSNQTGQPAGRSSGFRIILRPRLPVLLEQ